MRRNEGKLMPAAPVLFASWLSTDIAPALRPLGFRKSGSTFHLRGDRAWGVVNFQKSQWGSSGDTRFTVNLAVALDRLLEAKGDDPDDRPPVHRCNWRARVPELLGDRSDPWWEVTETTDLARLTAEVLPPLLEVGVPAIRARLGEATFVSELRVRPTLGVCTPPLSRVLGLLGAPSGSGEP